MVVGFTRMLADWILNFHLGASFAMRISLYVSLFCLCYVACNDTGDRPTDVPTWPETGDALIDTYAQAAQDFCKIIEIDCNGMVAPPGLTTKICIDDARHDIDKLKNRGDQPDDIACVNAMTDRAQCLAALSCGAMGDALMRNGACNQEIQREETVCSSLGWMGGSDRWTPTQWADAYASLSGKVCKKMEETCEDVMKAFQMDDNLCYRQSMPQLIGLRQMSGGAASRSCADAMLKYQACLVELDCLDLIDAALVGDACGDKAQAQWQACETVGWAQGLSHVRHTALLYGYTAAETQTCKKLQSTCEDTAEATGFFFENCQDWISTTRQFLREHDAVADDFQCARAIEQSAICRSESSCDDLHAFLDGERPCRFEYEVEHKACQRLRHAQGSPNAAGSCLTNEFCGQQICDRSTFTCIDPPDDPTP